MSGVDTAPAASPGRRHGFAVVDCDVHQYFVDGMQDLFPYVSESWRRRLGIGQSLAWGGNFANTRISLPKDELYINSGGGWRLDSLTEDMPPATDPAFVARHLLDEYEIARAILLGGHVLGLGAMPNAEMATVIASAYNDWMSERWLQADPRFRGSILVAPQLPERAAAEIDRVAGRPGIVQVLLPLSTPAMGEPHYYPIYEAAQRHGLPIVVHPSGTESIYPLGPKMAQAPHVLRRVAHGVDAAAPVERAQHALSRCVRAFPTADAGRRGRRLCLGGRPHLAARQELERPAR